MRAPRTTLYRTCSILRTRYRCSIRKTCRKPCLRATRSELHWNRNPSNTKAKHLRNYLTTTQNTERNTLMKLKLSSPSWAVLTVLAATMCAVTPSHAQDKKPNILFIMGDDIGWMQPSCYHRGLMVGEPPNIDRIAKEGGMFMHYYAESSCRAGGAACFTGMHPYRAGMVLRQLPGAISYLRLGPRPPPSLLLVFVDNT